MSSSLKSTASEEEQYAESYDSSTLYCDPDADIAFVSSDGVLFKLHSKFFEAVSAGFSIPNFTTAMSDDLVLLTEPAAVLEILFQFVHPPFQCEHFHQPSATDLEADLFFKLATAAEKYLVYSAMSICSVRMHYELYLTHPVQVLNHSENHGYSELSDRAAPITMSLPDPLQSSLKGLTNPTVAVKWVGIY
ncbi:hypothetical protein BDN70DRAFT_877175 [Pholiota conissans]|uniref:BTB domain-containing protein n=1 Tax=Pholiota conissans TaxID=109636 RepID=A0A9P5Z434_9AGAR|nr:hypothetical protein BDN70DRAFT_877175 [Pholiota conissans]